MNRTASIPSTPAKLIARKFCSSGSFQRDEGADQDRPEGSRPKRPTPEAKPTPVERTAVG